MTRLLARPRPEQDMERRSATSGQIVELLTAGASTAAGVSVTPESSLRYTAVLACVRVLAEGVASLPCIVYERQRDGGKTRAVGHRLYSLLHDAPNPVQTAFEFYEIGMAQALLWGNFYAEIDWDARGQVQALWPLPAWQMTPMWDRGGKVYELRDDHGKPFYLADYQVLHVPGFGYDGTAGRSMISLAREAVALGMAAQQFGSAFFGNGARPGVVLEHPGQLGDEAFKHLQGSWNQQHQGLSNAHRVAILEEGMKLQTLGVPPEDAQFLETRQFQRQEIAAIFRVPPHMIGDLERATFSNIEQQSQDFLTNSLQPWLRRWEQRLARSLLVGPERARYFAEYLVDALLRGDTETRYAAYAVGRQWGWLSVNDIRGRENMNPVDGGDEYLVPMNMAPAGELDGSDASDGLDGADGSAERSVRARTVENPEERAARDRRTVDGRRRLARTYRPTLRHMAQRIVNREVNDLRQAARRYLPGDVARFRTWLAEFDSKHAPFVGEYMDAPVRSYLALVGEQVERELELDKPVTPEMLEQFGSDYVAGRRNRWMANLMRDVDAVLAGEQRSGLDTPQTATRPADGERREDPDVLAEMESYLDERQESEAESYAEDESNTGSNAAAVALYLLLGVLTKKWMAFGESCEYCQALDGRTVGTATWFLDPDNPLSVASGPVWMPSGNVGHAPLHNGCDCMVVAG